jgi:hypothetical protein
VEGISRYIDLQEKSRIKTSDRKRREEEIFNL